MYQFLKKLKEEYLVLTFFLSLIISGFFFLHNSLNKYNDILETVKTTQQMSLKSVIWNESIPIGERASACDVYLNAGYNSMTKKECEMILERK